MLLFQKMDFLFLIQRGHCPNYGYQFKGNLSKRRWLRSPKFKTLLPLLACCVAADLMIPASIARAQETTVIVKRAVELPSEYATLATDLEGKVAKLAAGNKAAQADADSITEALKKPSVDEDMVKNFTAVAVTLEEGIGSKEGRFVPLEKAVDAVRKSNKKLTDYYDANYKKLEAKPPTPVAQAVIKDFKAQQTAVNAQLSADKKEPKAYTPLLKALKKIPEQVNLFLGLPLKPGEPYQGVSGQAKTVGELPANLDEQTLLAKLGTNLPKLTSAIHLFRLSEPLITRLTNDLNPAEKADLKAPPAGKVLSKPDFAPALAEVKKQTAAATKKLPDWSDTVRSIAIKEQTKTQTVLLASMNDAVHNGGNALAQSTLSTEVQKKLTSVVTGLQGIIAEAQLTDIPKGTLDSTFVPDGVTRTTKNVSDIQYFASLLDVSIKRLQGNLAPDKATWAAERIELAYFDDVPRLIQVLSGKARLIKGDKDDALQQNARNARVALLQASQNLETLDQSLSDSRQQVADLQERLRLTKLQVAKDQKASQSAPQLAASKAEKAEANALDKERLQKEAEGRQAVAQDGYNFAVDKLKNGDVKDKATLQTDVDRAFSKLQQAKLASTNALAIATQARKQADAAAGEAETALLGSSKQIEALQKQLTDAQDALNNAESARSTATSQQRAAVKDAFLAAEVENFSFAQARDNIPFWTNVPAVSTTAAAATPAASPVETDPIENVLLFAFPDSKTLFIRGTRKDINRVRSIIQRLDRPEGQALMTLWTLEISSDVNPRKPELARDMIDSLSLIDNELNNARIDTNKSLDLLRSAIKNEVDHRMKSYPMELAKEALVLKTARAAAAALAKTAEQELLTANNELEKQQANEKAAKDDVALAAARAKVAAAVTDVDAKQSAYNLAATNSLKASEKYEVNLDKLKLADSDPEQFAILAFYDDQLPERLGFTDRIFSALLKDFRFLNSVIPRPTNTSTVAQALVVLSLANDLSRKRIVDAFLRREMDFLNGRTHREKTLSPDEVFPNLRSFVGGTGTKTSVGVLNFQNEVVQRLRYNGLTPILTEAQQLARYRIELGKEFDDNKAKLLRARAEVPPDTLRIEQLKTKAHILMVEITDIESSLNIIFEWLMDSRDSENTQSQRERFENLLVTTDISELEARASGSLSNFRTSMDAAQEAASNEMFKQYIRAVDDDLNQAIISPMFKRLQYMLLTKKVRVGILQRTSLLASNRLVARVDPRASAQLAVGEENNVLEAARQLTNIFGVLGKGAVATSTGNPAALASSAAALGGNPVAMGNSTIALAQSALDSFDQLPREAAPAVYGIGTGNVFQVTPIADPSGQAMRFRFDMVASTQIREPNGTVDPMMPRIERHSINTEVQLSNQEIRLVSQFQANSQLGIPTTKRGGIPILKDLPLIKELPLLGWFVKRGGRAAEIQQSMIFCQTSMYPTIGDVINLMVRPPSFVDLNGD